MKRDELFGSKPSPKVLLPRDVRFGRAGTVSFESLPSEFGQKSSKFCSHSVGIHSFSVFQMVEKKHEKRKLENEKESRN